MGRFSSAAADIEAYRLMCAGRFADALAFAERAVAGTRVCIPAHGMLATILLQLGRPTEAEVVVSQALECQQGTADAYDGLAHASLLLGQHHRSNALYRRVVELSPCTARFWYNFASSERSFGRLPEAEAACDRAIGLDPRHHASYLLRSELRVQSPEANHIEQLRSELSCPQNDARARVLLAYALAKELDDLQCVDEAFRWFSEAARTRRQHLSYDVGTDEQKLRRIIEVFPKESARLSSGALGYSGRYIFIVGLPRSGTTLLEHILTGLSGVQSNGETDNFSRALMAAAMPGCRDVFAAAAASDPAVVAANYRGLADHGTKEERIIEKLPMNYLYLGAIHRALPHAKLLLVNRSPLDSCFAMYRTLFGEAYPFSYDLEDLARYYAGYQRLIHHWRASFGEHLLEIDYDDLVKAPLHYGAAVAEHCGLKWKAAAIEIDKSASVSLTASAAQIRRPIYGSSSGRWRRYRTHLEPLISALRHRGIPLPDDA